ncbi:protein-glutamate O-methyltransferase CheR [Kiloniella laminariae]|uniref:Chemotaxis protein methyltransferase n=1 Tax=Kiloniella laminariae TaxID=454162 RepID=A0ABT4LHF9_9PROT|nr:protein-glutamate O-methyltransferase CheR [Kiloniella laminariae]MCZ4280536.1 protein-glutamate O-methyltransferase CheR [Kiloniella laminariae]
MNVNDFEFISQFLKKRSGLVLSQDKAYLLESRLNPVARKWSLSGFDELVQKVRSSNDERLLNDITEAMTTNESFFFRDQKPFDQFRDLVLPHMLEKRASSKTIRIWSAACSSGQEPYTLAMLLKEAGPKLAGWKIEIIATDLSNEILNKAKEGVYTQFEVQRGLPINLLVKYFQQAGDRWQIDASIRNMVTYKTFNLLESPAALGKFDIVFCRNVLIYFEQATKSHVLKNIAKQMPDDGFLYLGGAETVLGISDDFQLIPGQRGIYGLVRGQAARAAVG